MAFSPQYSTQGRGFLLGTFAKKMGAAALDEDNLIKHFFKFSSMYNFNCACSSKDKLYRPPKRGDRSLLKIYGNVYASMGRESTIFLWRKHIRKLFKFQR
jgi:hypothetical protein